MVADDVQTLGGQSLCLGMCFGHSKFEEDAGVGPTVQENGQLDHMCNPYAQMLFEDLRCIRDLGSAESFDAMWSGSLLQLTEPECLEAFLAVDSRELRARFLAVETPPPGMDCDSCWCCCPSR